LKAARLPRRLVGYRAPMPAFLVLLRADPAGYDTLTPPDFAALAVKFDAWAAPLLAEGRFLGGLKLRSDGARTVSREGEVITVKDGPFGETKEVIGGYHLILADDFDHAARLCLAHPNVALLGGSLELRGLVAPQIFAGRVESARPGSS
jgi:hypothetical protein